jgi:hypothetical protein
MRFSEFLAGLDPEVHVTLLNDLTVGYGRVALAVRLHRQDPTSVAMLSALAAAHASLHAALTVLDPSDPADDEPVASTASVLALPARWETLVAGAPPDAIEAWLQVADEKARDALTASRLDADVDGICALMRDALHAIATIRDDALG